MKYGLDSKDADSAIQHIHRKDGKVQMGMEMNQNTLSIGLPI